MCRVNCTPERGSPAPPVGNNIGTSTSSTGTDLRTGVASADVTASSAWGFTSPKVGTTILFIPEIVGHESVDTPIQFYDELEEDMLNPDTSRNIQQKKQRRALSLAFSNNAKEKGKLEGFLLNSRIWRGVDGQKPVYEINDTRPKWPSSITNITSVTMTDLFNFTLNMGCHFWEKKFPGPSPDPHRQARPR